MSFWCEYKTHLSVIMYLVRSITVIDNCNDNFNPSTISTSSDQFHNQINFLKIHLIFDFETDHLKF